MSKKYTATTRLVASKARSKRLREAGGIASAAAITTVTPTQAGGSGHTHTNLSALEQISTDRAGYEWLTRIEETTDGEATVNRTVTEKVKAGYADIAGDLTEDSPAWEAISAKFLSRVDDDAAAGLIRFARGLVADEGAALDGGATFGSFMSGLHAGMGGAIDQRGNAEVESLRVRSYMEVLELVINRLSAIEGDQILTEGDTVESVDDLGGGRYGLHLRPKWDGYFTAITAGSVLKGIVNTLAEGGGDYYTSWLRVNSANPAANYIECSLYPADETPAGANFPPCELMRVARWGHQTDPERQTCLFLSSTEGRIVKLKGVTQPIIAEDNYAASFGTVPEFVQRCLSQKGFPIAPNDDVLYADSIVVKNLYQYPKGDGALDIVYADRGAWQAGGLYYHKAVNPDGDPTKWEVSDVWHFGCKWRCMANLTAEEPAWNSTAWAFLEGNPNLVASFAEPEQLYDLDNLSIPLTLRLTLYNQDVTGDIADADVMWTRYTEDESGARQAASDTVWATAFAASGRSGKAVVLGLSDIGINAGRLPRRCVFTATATLADGMQAAASLEVGI